MESNAGKSWKVMLNVMRAIKNMKTFSVQEIESVREIDNYLKWSHTRSFKKAFTLNNKNMLNNLIKNNTSVNKSPQKPDNNGNLNNLKENAATFTKSSVDNINCLHANTFNTKEVNNNEQIEQTVKEGNNLPKDVRDTGNYYLTVNDDEYFKLKNSSKGVNDECNRANEHIQENQPNPNTNVGNINHAYTGNANLHNEVIQELSQLEFDEEDFNEPSYESMYNFKFKQDTLNNMINEYAKISECVVIASTGEESDLKKLKKIIMSDPKRNIFSKSERDRYFVNQKTPEGVTFLYQACLNGHINVVELLLDCDADHLVKSGKKDEEQLSVLDAAVRWSHLKLVSYLVEESPYKLEWPREYMTSALKIAEKIGNRHLIGILKKKLKSSGSADVVWLALEL
eukprot:CAMPEP_0170525488 /NCGR_PEP_ID=MMETSP0209-20121228/10959_1 /TAXON_ID=665100 ORGANISM="Litonotus pictus, Strain P1" /NCGR_SAMPLE_ID=MMETSP0209 /ASSEMBLY_ACC=CAM_ASM_000301 /LENGTH=397 /DNA_ID=CAMNT_0010814771 /DNA_START=653 /DNA_END=1844 /DNA_ORIENTATION=-